MTEAKEAAEIKVDLVPQRDKILVKTQQMNETPGGIVLAGANVHDKDDLVRATVLAVGNWVRLEQDGKPGLDLHEGDVICHGPYAGIPVKVDGEAGFKLIPAADVLAIMTRD